VAFRFYGPLEGYIEKTWVMNDFEPLKKELILVIPVIFETEESDYLTLFCNEKLLLTFHSKLVLSPDKLERLQRSEVWLPERSIAGLVSAIMIDVSLDCLNHTNKLRDAIVALEEKMERHPGFVQSDEIFDLRSALISIGAMVGEQLPSLKALTLIDKPFFQLKDSKDYLNCALVNLQSTDEAMNWLDGRLHSIRAGFQMNAQEKTNRRLNMLTILSAIFLPMTLMTGIWGMNFETMPELTYSYSYPIALGSMVLVGCGMYFYFRRTGWFE
jgi:magnesium transporter